MAVAVSFEALHPIDGALDQGIEALHAEACAIDPAICQRIDHWHRECARVDLDGDFGRRRDKEGVPDRPDQVRKVLGRHDRGRSTAKVDVVDVDAATNLPRYQIDFASQGGGIDGNGLVTANDRRVAAAIPAHRPAERNVQVQ